MRSIDIDLIDFGVVFSGDVESILGLISENGANSSWIEPNEIVQLNIHKLLTALSLHC